MVSWVRKSISHLTLILGLRRKIFSLNKFSNLVAHACECGSSLLNRTFGVQTSKTLGKVELIFFFLVKHWLVVYFVNETILNFQVKVQFFVSELKNKCQIIFGYNAIVNYRKVLDLDNSSKSYSFQFSLKWYSELSIQERSQLENSPTYLKDLFLVRPVFKFST